MKSMEFIVRDTCTQIGASAREEIPMDSQASASMRNMRINKCGQYLHAYG